MDTLPFHNFLNIKLEFSLSTNSQVFLASLFLLPLFLKTNLVTMFLSWSVLASTTSSPPGRSTSSASCTANCSSLISLLMKVLSARYTLSMFSCIFSSVWSVQNES